MTLGQRIKQLRNTNGWSQEVMADKLNLSLQAYSNIERDITDISISRLKQIAKIFGVSQAALLDEENEILKRKIVEQDAEISALQKDLLDCLKKKAK